MAIAGDGEPTTPLIGLPDLGERDGAQYHADDGSGQPE